MIEDLNSYIEKPNTGNLTDPEMSARDNAVSPMTALILRVMQKHLTSCTLMLGAYVTDGNADKLDIAIDDLHKSIDALKSIEARLRALKAD